MKKFAIAVLSIVLTACVSHTYLAKQQYMLHSMHGPFLKAENALPANITVSPMLAGAPFNGLQFIYRVKHSRYLNDYYNIFMTPPNDQLTTATTQFLTKTGLFKHVNAASLILPTDYVLKSQLLALYADYRNDHHPKAMMRIQFILLQNNQIVFQKIFSADRRLTEKSTKALVHAWNMDTTVILSHLSQALFQHFRVSPMQNRTMTMPARHQATPNRQDFLSLTPAPAQQKPVVHQKALQRAPHNFLTLDN